MAAPTAPTGLRSSTWLLLTQRPVTWRQATQGWVVIGTLAAAALTALTLFRLARRLRSVSR